MCTMTKRCFRFFTRLRFFISYLQLQAKIVALTLLHGRLPTAVNAQRVVWCNMRFVVRLASVETGSYIFYPQFIQRGG